jgi:predicted RNase H-like HicB family nuclease
VVQKLGCFFGVLRSTTLAFASNRKYKIQILKLFHTFETKFIRVMTQKDKLTGRILSKTSDKNIEFKDLPYKYEIIIFWSQEDQRFIAEVPELAGCMADGENQIEAIINVKLAIDEWLETAIHTKRNIPQPKGRFLLA